MEKSEIEIGMKVRISEDLTVTQNTWGLTPEMEKMKGKVYSVYDINPPYIYDNESNYYWQFSPGDLLGVEIKPPPPPVIFDVNNLELAEQHNK